MSFFTKIIFYSILIFSFATCQPSNESSSELSNPNVILIMTDDQGWGDLGAHGNPWLKTPVLDRMAADGAQFERFYVSPLCAPTRASLLTGRYFLRTGTSWVSKGLENMNPEEVTLGEVFKENGYVTGCFGKWHNGAHYPQHPNQQGFDDFYGFCAGHWNNYFNTGLEHNGALVQSEGYITDVLTNKALEFMEMNQKKSFFCYVPYNVPHSPFQVPDEYFNKYKEMGLSDKDACVYAMCENMDGNIGRLLQKVDDLGIAEKTIIIFLTDNGPNGDRYNGGMRGWKGFIHEGGVRVPCFVQWKGVIQKGTVISQLGSHIDWLPTLINLCNLETPETLPLDGIDLSPLILNQREDWTTRLLFTKKSTERIIPDGAVRSDQYRLIIENNDTTLFDMIKDAGQKISVADQYPEVVRQLTSAYDQWFQAVTEDFQPFTDIEIGFEGEETVSLPAHESTFTDGLQFKEGHGWAHDWLVNWTSIHDSIFWEVVVEDSSEFEASLVYNCAENNIGSRIILQVDGQHLETTITEAYDPEYISSPDRVVRKEVYEKEWAKLAMGKISIPKGRQNIVVKAVEIPGTMACELKGLVLER